MRRLILLAALALPLAAQQPRIQNGALSVASVSSLSAELDRLKAQDAVTWLAYTIPTPHRIQNGWDPDHVTYLEGNHNRDEQDEQTGAPKEIYRALLLLRVANHQVQAVRVEDPDRKIDAGGAKVEFLPTVEPAESISVLQGLADGTNRLRDGAIFAISLHHSPAMLPALIALGSPNHDLAVREKAAFWLSTQHGKEALPVIDRWIREDKDDRFREKLTFNLSQIHTSAATDLLIRTARGDASPQVRRQAQFWMANIASKQVVGNLGDAAENDPEESVRKSAVFGLSRLPDGQGIPRLIELAQTSKDAGVRKQAVFWLGQSGDPRALDFLVRLVKQ